MDHIPRFKIDGLQQGKESVVGNCNGRTCEERWEKETPAFAKAILRQLPEKALTVLDYGCGIGRLAKEVLNQNQKITIIGLDASKDELKTARAYVNDSRFLPMLPEELSQKVDMAYCVYVLQHVPAIELRHVLERIHYFLKPGGRLVYCSSDYRMAINTGGGFTDDRHLGVNIRHEVERLFTPECDLFNLDKEDNIIRAMVTAEGCPQGSIAHPAIVYRRKDIDLSKPYFMAPSSLQEGQPDNIQAENSADTMHTKSSGLKRLILQNRLAPGDILVMTAALRSLHRAYPGQFITDVEAPCMEIFDNNPYVTRLNGEGQRIDMQYPLISNHEVGGLVHPGSGISGRHFSDGYRKFLEEILEITIPRSGLTPEIYLSQDERLWPSPVLKDGGWEGQYWLINAGSKSDFTLKQYHKYQEVVDILIKKWNGSIKIVQIGAESHNHKALKGVIDLRGKTGHRELYRAMYHADGLITCVSYPMHIAAALNKPCVVVAGGREGTRWELYPNQKFLYTNGSLPCCSFDGCWKSKLEECSLPVQTSKGTAPKCMEMIKPYHITDAVESYYEGGILQREEVHV